jgi:hypothetical protein
MLSAPAHVSCQLNSITNGWLNHAEWPNDYDACFKSKCFYNIQWQAYGPRNHGQSKASDFNWEAKHYVKFIFMLRKNIYFVSSKLVETELKRSILSINNFMGFVKQLGKGAVGQVTARENFTSSQTASVRIREFVIYFNYYSISIKLLCW